MGAKKAVYPTSKWERKKYRAGLYSPVFLYLYEKELHMHFSFYIIDSDYCSFLRKADPCVPYTMDRKAGRPFIGIILSINSFHYYAPLTSPKPKHLHMKSQVDFLKIKNGEWGAINLNNMIPVPINSLKHVDIKISENDTAQDIAYKNLLSNQLSWCNSHKDIILKQADKLYHIIVDGKGWESLVNRCCNFALDEEQCCLFSAEK